MAILHHAFMLDPRPAKTLKKLSIVPALQSLIQSLAHLQVLPSNHAPNRNAGYEGKLPCQPFFPSGQFAHPVGLRTILINDRFGSTSRQPTQVRCGICFRFPVFWGTLPSLYGLEFPIISPGAITLSLSLYQRNVMIWVVLPLPQIVSSFSYSSLYQFSVLHLLLLLHHRGAGAISNLTRLQGE